MSDMTDPAIPPQDPPTGTGDPGAPDSTAGAGAPDAGGTEAPSSPSEGGEEGASNPPEDDTNPALGVAPLEAQPPGAEVRALDTTVANVRVPNGDEATHVIVHDDGTVWFHSLVTIPKRFLDAAGDVVLGRHLNVTREEAEGTAPVEAPAEEPAAEEPAPEAPAEEPAP